MPLAAAQVKEVVDTILLYLQDPAEFPQLLVDLRGCAAYTVSPSFRVTVDRMTEHVEP